MLVQESLDLEPSFSDAMRFIPMQLGTPNPTTRLPDCCYSFALAPAPNSISFAETRKVSDAPFNGKGFNLGNLADQFKVYSSGHCSAGYQR